MTAFTYSDTRPTPLELLREMYDLSIATVDLIAMGNHLANKGVMYNIIVQENKFHLILVTNPRSRLDSVVGRHNHHKGIGGRNTPH